MPLRRLLITFVALAVAACSGSSAGTTTTAPATTLVTTTTSANATTTTTGQTTTTTAPTTTTTLFTTVTTLPEGFRSPINGLSPVDEILLDRRAVAAKIDNSAAARPQSGVQEADAVIEMLKESGETRLMPIWHDNDSAYVGPHRSLRPTDSTLIPVIGAPLIISGGQPFVQELAVGRGVNLLGESTQGMHRISSRIAPHNLYGTTDGYRATADARGINNDSPGWLYEIGEWPIPEEIATEIVLSWSANTTVTWRYEDGVYHRWHGNSPHNWRDIDGNEGPLAADVIVVLAGATYLVPPPGNTGATVVGVETIGSGNAWVFSLGRVWQGTWQRDSLAEPYTLLDGGGTEAVVPPGVPWVEIFPEERSITFS
jgi:hypothetical protein